jgi:LCP family protein required for cell wall assembly
LSDTSQHDADGPAHSASAEPDPPRRRRRVKRIVLVSVAGLMALVVVIAGGGYLFANHILSGVHRISVPALTAPHQPVGPAATRSSVTVLLTADAVGTAPHGRVPASSKGPASGLISLIHLDANKRGGAVISLPPNAMVPIPGHGKKDLGDALALGGPSLLVETVERLTNVRINHYSVLSFSGALAVIDALGGVNVDVPYATTSSGYTFHQGINHIDSHSALAYARQDDVSEIGRELLQQNLIRSMVSKIAQQRLFRNPTVDYRLVRALAGALSVDSNLSNSQLVSLAVGLGNLGSSDGTFVDAPTIRGSATRGGDKPVHLKRALSQKLWQAIRNDSVAAFALRHPSTVTSVAPD